MESYRSLFISVWLCLIFIGKECNAQSPDVGVIFIGNPADEGTPSVSQYTFSNYDLAGKSLTVYGLVYSGSNPTTIVLRTEDVVITCSVVTEETGYSEVSFPSQAILSVAENSTTIDLQLNKDRFGRGAEVVCSGNSSQSANATCPPGTGGPQFCPETSQSNVVSIVVLPPATISLCDSEVSVKNIATSQQFTVRLSEVAVDNVSVLCSVSSPPTNVLELTIQPLTIEAGKNEGNVLYNKIGGNAGSTANVICNASSANGQFVLSSSASDFSSVTFVLQGQTLTFEPVYSEISNTSFVSLLKLSTPIVVGMDSVQVSCQAKLVPSLIAAQAEVANPDCNPSTVTTAAPVTSGTTLDPNATITPAPPNPNSDWYVVDSTMDITSQDSGQNQYRVVITERRQPPTDIRTEVVVTTCCVQPGSSPAGRAAVAVAVARLAPFPCQSCTNNATIEELRRERTIQNPGYVEIAPCPCDLTENVCDINCCCDTDCSARQVQTRFSSCIPGLPGGQAAQPEDYKCDAKSFNLPDWHLLTCVYWESNAYLGMFYKNQNKLTTEAQISAAVSRKYKGRFSFKETERRFETSTTGYSYGSVVTTRRADLGVNKLYSKGILALPLSNGERCNPLTPVRFLVDASSTCSVTLTSDLCSGSTVFSGRIYAASSLNDSCSQSFKVTSTEDGSAAEADVRYYLATNLESYLGGTPSAPLDPQMGSKFPPDLEGLTCDDGCSLQKCWQYNTGREVPSSVPPLPSDRPEWDTGFEAPPVPSSDGRLCENAVLEVRYNFEWSGNTIRKLTADVVLGNVTLGSVVRQRFSTSWAQQKSNASLTVSDNFANTNQPYQRSGSGGYDVGKPLISGCSNQTISQTEPVDRATEKQMAVWKPGVDGLCVNAARQLLTFGEDMMSSCELRLTFSDLDKSCQLLRDQILNHMNVLFAANVLGKSGSNNPANPEDWITVIRRNVINDQNSLQPMTNGTPIAETVLLEELITGVCRVPESVELTVLYAQTGASNFVPRLEVVGAYINYTYANWSMNCAGANRRRCESGSTFTESFYLRSSTRFIKVPANPDRKSSFYTRLNLDNCDSDTCYRFASDFARDICYYETCWQELAYPLTAAYKGEENRYFTMAFFLVLVLGVVGYAAVARPGWS